MHVCMSVCVTPRCAIIPVRSVLQRLRHNKSVVSSFGLDGEFFPQDLFLWPLPHLTS
jgi:hypothetical protein